MKDKRQQREEEHCQTFSLPTGGVDIAQLTALGICPPPYTHHLGTASPLTHSFSVASSLPKDCNLPISYLHPSVTTSTETSTAIHRPVPSIAQSQERISAFTSMRNASDRNMDIRSDERYLSSPPYSSGYPGLVATGLHIPYPIDFVPNYNIPYLNSFMHSPYFNKV